jgi:hypothetical protein
MKEAYAAIAVLLTFIHQSYANLDIITLNTIGGTWIQEAEGTLAVGDVPSPMTGDVALWSAIMTDKGTFSKESPKMPNLGILWLIRLSDTQGHATNEPGMVGLCAQGIFQASRIRL